MERSRSQSNGPRDPDDDGAGSDGGASNVAKSEFTVYEVCSINDANVTTPLALNTEPHLKHRIGSEIGPVEQ